MANRKTFFMSEEYLNDVSESIFSNLTRAVKKRALMFIWGPTDTSTYAGNNFRSEMEENCHSTCSTSNDSYFTVNEDEDRRSNGSKTKYENQNSPPLSINRNVGDKMSGIRTENSNSEMEIPSKVVRKKRTMSENEELQNSRKNPAFGSKRNGGLLDEFSEWCNKRHTEFESNKFKTSSNNSINSSPSFKVDQNKQNIISEPKECLSVKQEINNCTGLISRNNNNNNNEPMQTVERQTKSNNSSMKVKEKKNTPSNILKENYEKTFEDKDFGKSASKKKENLEDPNLLSIKLINEDEEKSYEFIQKVSDIFLIQRRYPKLVQIIPNFDAKSNKIAYSIEAVNIIFRYLLNQDYKLENAVSSPIYGIEVLAATRSWEIYSLHEKLKDYFLHEVVTPSNVLILFSYAKKYGLEEICKVCETIAPPKVSLNPQTFRKDKKCFITVSTYVSPLECSFPFTPLSGGLQMSFERHIKNTVRFETISGCYKIIGFQLQLNEDHLNKNKSLRELIVCYNAKNKSSNQAILDQSVEKGLRPRNIVHLKRGLIVNSHEMGEIAIEIDIKPYLCSESEDSRMKFNSEQFKVSVLSSFPLRHDENHKLFFIKKIFYHNIK